MDEHPASQEAADSPQLPEIAVSRTSSQGSSKKASKSRPEATKKPSLRKVKTDHPFHKLGNGHTTSWDKFHDPGPGWHIKWDQDCFHHGRVLIIDYKSHGVALTESSKRHIAVEAQEFQTLQALRKFYSDNKRVHSAALRVIHVQNAPWATLFLLRKFNINHPSELVGMPGFSKWARYEKPRQRSGKPFPNGRSWRGQTDPWRNVARTAYGLDYLKTYPTDAPNKRRPQNLFGSKPIDAHLMHLNAYEDGSNPYGYDVAVQRMSVYVQRNLGPPQQISPEIDKQNPYSKHMPSSNIDGDLPKEEEKAFLDCLDNSNTVIVFETSASMQLEHCLVQPRNDFEKRWRRLSFYLRKEDVLNDSRLAATCTNFILSDIFHGLAIVWDEFLGAAADHVAILEDKIYENPADESRAPELWINQAHWLKVDKIVWIHSDLVREMQVNMRDLADEDDEVNGVEVDWLATAPTECDRINHSINEDLVTPTNNLSDLMYKSVGIRDSRQSLQLGLSMWRLSWITFIFLPLTFIVGFFGMNVDTFSSNPSIGWYFVAAAVLMVLVLILWYGVKHSLQQSRQTPYQRGLYESLFDKLEEDYPELWTTNGAADGVQPAGMASRIKWRLIRRWFAPEKTINKRLYSSLAPEEAAGELGAWASVKRYLLLRWLDSIKTSSSSNDQIEQAETGTSTNSEAHYEKETINQLAKYSTPIVMADAEPNAVVAFSALGLRPLLPREKRRSRTSEERPSSRGSSGIMIEERNLSDSESDTGDVSTRTGSDGRRVSS